MTISLDLKDNAPLTIKDAQTHMEMLCRHFEWDKADAYKTFLLFVEEVGELAKEIRKNDNLFPEEAKKADPDIEGEFADVFSYILDLANRFGVDLEKAYKEKTEINLSRKWE